MSGSHGDLFSEIGTLVLAANSGMPIDLAAKSEELAERYGNLGLSEEIIARTITRSIGAIGLSMAVVSTGARPVDAGAIRWNGGDKAVDQTASAEGADAVKALFPSGVRLAVLS